MLGKYLFSVSKVLYGRQKFFHTFIPCLRPVDISYSLYNAQTTNESLPSLVIIHGLFGSKKNFDSLAKVFSKNTGLQIISIDARNHGESEHSSEMSYHSMAEDVIQLLGSLNIKSSVLLGHSMGGKIAMTTALTQPELVKGLIVVDMVPDRSVTADTDYFPRMINMLKSISFDSSPPELSIINARKIASQQMSDVVDDIRVRNFLLTNLIQRNNKIFWRLNLQAIGNAYDSLMNFPDLEGKTYEGKTLFIGGSTSDMISEKHYPNIKKFFPQSEVTHVFGSGHWVHADNPTEFSNIVIQFLKTLLNLP